ncbi:hypothetical protein V5O48_003102 [Marasmius crinis-equi]|uniref:Uncharacterized protein n=1 Tax=Marasmius crinis-equi TaxID=585013 RepID=A0ABR3FUM0_9AGAR
MAMLLTERRYWTAEEDQVLREAVDREDPGNPTPSKWYAISKCVPGRTNKDCRKRWYAKIAFDGVKGAWSPDEDEKLVKAIEKYGTRYVPSERSPQYVRVRVDSDVMAQVVNGRVMREGQKQRPFNVQNDGQILSTPPLIVRDGLHDSMLINAVDEYGKSWTKIVQIYFPGRTGLSAKNRYNSITRSNRGPSRTRRQISPAPRESEGAFSCWSSVSPVTTLYPTRDNLSILYNSPRNFNFSIVGSSCSPTLSIPNDESSSKSMVCNDLSLPVNEMGSGGKGDSTAHLSHPTIETYGMPPLSQFQAFDMLPDSTSSTPGHISTSQSDSLFQQQQTQVPATRLPALETSERGGSYMGSGSHWGSRRDSTDRELCSTASSAEYFNLRGCHWESNEPRLHWKKGYGEFPTKFETWDP